MSCGRCDDGWIYVGDAARACSCQVAAAVMASAAAAREGKALYAPGGVSTRARRRAQARVAGYASGRARRARSTACREPRPRSRQEALALRYRIRQVNRDEFEQRYAAMCDAQGLPVDLRGLNTAHELYRALWRSYRAQGQDWQTTNQQLSRALEIAGRGRCRRTIQRVRKRLVAMRLIVFEHVRRSGHLRLPGHMDTLRVRCLCPSRKANVTPPSGARAEARSSPRSSSTSTATALIAPPAAADYGGPAAPAGSERDKLRADLDFVQLKLELGFGNPVTLALERSRLRQLVRYADDGPGQVTSRTFANRSEGFR